jgi:hypothetical protein
VPDHDHLAERGIAPLRVEALHRGLEGVPEEPARVTDRVAGVVLEEPELIALRDRAIIAELVHEVAPAPRARGGAVHENHGDPARAVGLEEEEAELRASLLDAPRADHRGAQRAEGAHEETLQLELEEVRFCEGFGQCKRRLELDRDRASIDLERVRLVRSEDLDPSPQPPIPKRRARAVEAQHHRRRHAHLRHQPLGARRRLFGERAQRGREGSSDAGPPVAIAQAANGVVRGVDQVLEAMPGPAELGRVDLDLERAEGQRELAPARRARLGAHHGRERAVVQVVGEPHAGIRRIEGLAARPREEQRVGIDGGRELVAGVAAALAVIEGELREPGQAPVIALRLEPCVEQREHHFGLLLEARAQIEALEELVRAVGGAPGGQHVRGELAMHLLRILAVHAYGRRAGGEQRRGCDEPGGGVASRGGHAARA